MDSAALEKSDFKWFLEMPTRWIDNDLYGHMNNAVYYSVFETVLMTWLEIEQGFVLSDESVRVFAVENGCRYLDSVRHPETIQCGLRISKIGNSSVRYEVGIFKPNSNTAAAIGFIVNVFVDEQTERPVSVPKTFRKAMESLLI